MVFKCGIDTKTVTGDGKKHITNNREGWDKKCLDNVVRQDCKI